jgi:uncharacterized protein (DUF58 family)
MPMFAAIRRWCAARPTAGCSSARRSTGRSLPEPAPRVHPAHRRRLGFAALLLVLLIGSINYNLGLGYALTFLALHLRAGRHVPHLPQPGPPAPAAGPRAAVFAGEEALFELHVRNRSARPLCAMGRLRRQRGEARHADRRAGRRSTPACCWRADRGARLAAAPRVTLATRFPLGLFAPGATGAGPARAGLPLPGNRRAAAADAGRAPRNDGAGRAGRDDFAGVRSYQPGDSLRHLAWRQIARLDPATAASWSPSISKAARGRTGARL